MTVVTRFAPSPTGYLHIGGARTALFNWLYARHTGGKFLLRIEDTDRARSTEDAVRAILEGLKWLELDWDGDAVSQFERKDRHAEVARQMLEMGRAYYCYCTPEELEEMRARAKAEGRPVGYDGRWRDRDPAEAPAGVKPVIRLKAPLTGESVIHDLVQGEVKVDNRQLDDMILLRSDGTPTYMLAVVVDDHDAGVTHVIRGDDHLNNAFRQRQIYEAMGWDVPQYAHIPLIHGPDGAKLSKRHGALGIEAYRDMGYLPAAMRNYLLRLGWGHGDTDIISTEDAIKLFDVSGIGRSPARMDFTKLDHVSGIYIRQAADKELAGHIMSRVETEVGTKLTLAQRDLLEAAMPGLKDRAKTLNDLAEAACFLVRPLPLPFNDKAQSLVREGREVLAAWQHLIAAAEPFSAAALEESARALAEQKQIKLGAVAQPLRAALSGSNVSPPIFEVAALLGRDETLRRIEAAIAMN
ncbi:glutamate--tRNA ligase [Radicibacter daui]|uniref:glutamate--tRNA ligase n=1 Tax=Radicibacter daui TaxID=3064829 RepID=UPI004046A5E5